MSANANDMSLLINKIERRLGLLPITPHLPKEYSKAEWANVVKTDTLPTFSRYYPNRMSYLCTNDTVTVKDGWYYLKDDIIGDNKVLGVTDINWTDMGNSNLSLSQLANYGYPEIYGFGYYGASSVYADQAIGLALNADITSMFNNGNSIYVETDDGNPMRFRIVGISNHTLNLKTFSIFVILEHKDLATISPTKMNTFEALAQADIAGFLYNNLKYFDGLETIYAQIDLKMGDLQNEAQKRDQIIETLQNSYVSFSNQVQHLIVVD
jgi:hypothetical protein